MEVNIHYAKTNLSQLLLKAESGEEIVVARAGKPIVRLVPVQIHEPKKLPAGTLKDVHPVTPDAFYPGLDEEIVRWFNESPLLRIDRVARQEKSGKKSRKHGKHKK